MERNKFVLEKYITWVWLENGYPSSSKSTQICSGEYCVHSVQYPTQMDKKNIYARGNSDSDMICNSVGVRGPIWRSTIWLFILYVCILLWHYYVINHGTRCQLVTLFETSMCDMSSSVFNDDIDKCPLGGKPLDWHLVEVLPCGPGQVLPCLSYFSPDCKLLKWKQVRLYSD